MVTIFEFLTERFQLILIHRLSRCFLPSFKSIGFPIQENSGKLIFQIATMTAILDFRSEKFKLFYLKVIPMLPTKFQVDWPFDTGEKETDFRNDGHGDHLGFPIGTILAIFNLQVSFMLPTELQDKWPFGSGDEAKTRFSRLPPRRLSWISNWNYFNYYWSTSHPDASY